MIPKYKEMYSDIKEKIITGIWYDNMLIPTEAELCENYNVSRITVRHALEELENEALIVRMQGRGTFVKTKRTAHGENAKGFMQVMAEQGYVIITKILLKEVIKAPLKIVDRLHLSPEADIWHFKRLRCNGKYPIALMDIYVVKEIGDRMQGYDLENISFYKLYREISQKDIQDSPGTITACNPTDEECKLMNVVPGSAHLLFKSTAYIDNCPIEYSESIYNSTYTEFVVGMRDQRIHTLPRD